MSDFKQMTVSNHLIRVVALTLIFVAVYFAMQPLSAPNVQAQSDRGLPGNIPRGELVFVPIYSSIFYDNAKQTIELAATLSVHNVNPDNKITILRVDYYDTEGRLIKKYLQKPLVLNGLQTTNFVVEKSNTAGGTGANFLVEWQSMQDVTSPIIEAVMINASSNLGIAFTTSGKVVRQTTTAVK